MENYDEIVSDRRDCANPNKPLTLRLFLRGVRFNLKRPLDNPRANANVALTEARGVMAVCRNGAKYDCPPDCPIRKLVEDLESSETND